MLQKRFSFLLRYAQIAFNVVVQPVIDCWLLIYMAFQGEESQLAKDSGADIVGGPELISQVRVTQTT